MEQTKSLQWTVAKRATAIGVARKVRPLVLSMVLLRSAVLRWLEPAPELGFAVSINLHAKLVRRIRGSVGHRWCKVYSPSLREVLLPCSGGIQLCVFLERARVVI